jgi:type I restriction enzyme S subunit
MRAHTTGTTVLHLSSAGIPNFTFHCPPDALIQAYNDFATPLFSQIEANIIENSNLAKMRDLLLPGLLSGELRIKDAERFLEIKS